MKTNKKWGSSVNKSGFTENITRRFYSDYSKVTFYLKNKFLIFRKLFLNSMKRHCRLTQRMETVK
jgi:hypothetical protein